MLMIAKCTGCEIRMKCYRYTVLEEYNLSTWFNNDKCKYGEHFIDNSFQVKKKRQSQLLLIPSESGDLVVKKKRGNPNWWKIKNKYK